MFMTLSNILIAVDTVFLILSSSSVPLIIWFARFTEPRLQTAISSLALVFNVISVQRFEE